MAELVEAAAAYARANGARHPEACPLERRAKPREGYAGYTGVASVFRRLRFRRDALREDRPIMRRRLSPPRS
jgi:hypothetical protein